MKIKMVGLDLDGTLLNSQKEISSYTLQILQRAMENGVEIVIATGRALCGIPKQLLELSGIKYIVTANGARIVDIQKDIVLFKTSMDKRAAKQVLHMFGDYDTAREIFIDGESYMEVDKLSDIAQYLQSEAMAQYVRNTRKKTDDLDELLENTQNSIEKVHAIFRNEKERKEAWARVEKLVGIEICGSFGNNIEANAQGVNKGKSLLHLGEICNIKQAEIMAIGDDLNDMEMIKLVGLGVAMENGNDLVKKTAKHITSTNDTDGVAKAIAKFVLNESRF